MSNQNDTDQKYKGANFLKSVSLKKIAACFSCGFRECFKFLKSLSVEPIAIFIFLAFQLWLTCFQTGLYQTVCYQLYHSNSSINCQKPIRDESIQNNIQQTLASWFMILMLAFILPGMISSCLLGAWADLVGRKTNLVLCISGMVIAVFPLTIIFTYRLTPLWVLAITHFIGGCCGFLGLIFTSAMAYLTDTILEKKDLTIRMVMFSVLMSISGVVGALVSGALLERVHMSVIVVIIEVLFVISLIYTLVTLEQLPPILMRKKILAKHMKANGTIHDPTPAAKALPEKTPLDDKQDAKVDKKVKKNCCSQLFIAVPGLVRTLVKDTIWTYKQARSGKHRTFLILTVVILFLHMMADTGVKGNIMGQYVMKSPFNWNGGSKLGYWRAANSILSFFGNITGIIIFKKLLKFKDTTIMLISIISGIGELILLGIAKNDWMLYLAVAVGCLSNLIMPTVASFTTQLVESDEIGKSFVAHGLASSLAFIASTLLFQSMYKATVAFYSGFVFLFGAAMMGICFAVILWMHLSITRDEKNADNINADRKLSDIVMVETAHPS